MAAVTTASPSPAPAGALGVADPATLELRDIAKHYGGLRAVDGVSTIAKPGEVLGIAGPNGAGKTTLFDVVTGLTEATAGEVLLGGEPLAGATVSKRCHRGMARTFQQPTVAGSLTTFENLVVAARYGRAAEHWNGLGADPDADAEWALQWSGLDARADEPAELLGVFDKKRLMIATAVVLGPRTLLLDEPFGGLNGAEIDKTLALIEAVAGFGVAVVCIEHVMRALVQLSARVLVMHQGKPFFEGTPQEMLADRRVIEIYLGEKAARHAGR